MASPKWENEPPAHYKALWAKEQQDLRLWEEPGCYGLSVASAEELTTTEPESWERRLDWLESFTDESTFDDDGMVR